MHDRLSRREVASSSAATRSATSAVTAATCGLIGAPAVEVGALDRIGDDLRRQQIEGIGQTDRLRHAKPVCRGQREFRRQCISQQVDAVDTSGRPRRCRRVHQDDGVAAFPVVDQGQGVAGSFDDRDIARNPADQLPHDQWTDAVIAAIGIADADDQNPLPPMERS